MQLKTSNLAELRAMHGHSEKIFSCLHSCRDYTQLCSIGNMLNTFRRRFASRPFFGHEWDALEAVYRIKLETYNRQHLLVHNTERELWWRYTVE